MLVLEVAKHPQQRERQKQMSEGETLLRCDPCGLGVQIEPSSTPQRAVTCAHAKDGLTETQRQTKNHETTQSESIVEMDTHE
jgi:hypothetical protein